MTLTRTVERSSRPELRLWPGILAVSVQWLLWLGVPFVFPDSMLIAVGGGMLGGLAIIVWWTLFSRAPMAERLGAVALIIAAMFATPRILHPSLATGMMGMLFPMYATPLISLALVAWAVATRRLADGPRRAALVGAVAAACGILALLRTDGITGDGRSQFAWRWATTEEQQLLARSDTPTPVPPPSATKEVPAEASAPPSPMKAASSAPVVTPLVLPAAIPPPRVEARAAEWPGFRGPGRDGSVSGLRIETDWTSSPPVELWRRPVGPGWSSFAVGEGLVYTQEQRGDFEVVACYRLDTGEPVWAHRTSARFWESNAGAGPRGTPTLAGGRVYALGATGIVNALDAATGALIWTRNAASDTGAAVPEWGFASSPLVVRDVVIVAASGRLAAYDAGAGNPRWLGPNVKGSYSSPHLLTIGGVEQVVLLSNSGATSFAPADGAVLWTHAWPGASMLQPAGVGDGGMLMTTASAAGGLGTRRLAVARGPDRWTADEVWTSIGLKPYFNDLVVHKGYAFGFDGAILSCIDLTDGKRKWKGGRYGHGQLVVLTDQDVLLVLSEEGELALVAASPDGFHEIARRPAMEGKTWNHPAVVGDILLVRNGQEMVAFRLARAGS